MALVLSLLGLAALVAGFERAYGLTGALFAGGVAALIIAIAAGDVDLSRLKRKR